MVAVPAETPVTRPVLLTVAIAVLEDDHGVVASGVPLPVSCVVESSQTANVPVIVGNAVTVMVAVTSHALLLVYLMVAVPLEIPVTSPALLTVATDVLEETHGLDVAGSPLPVSCVVDPAQTAVVPVIVGNAFTVTFAVIWHPSLFL